MIPAKRLEASTMRGIQRLNGMSAREADKLILSYTTPKHRDTTHFDVERFPPHPFIQNILDDALADGAKAYTPYRGDAEVLGVLRKNLALHLQVEDLEDENILITPGTQAALFNYCNSFIEAGDGVAIFDPEYLFTARILEFCNANVQRVPLGLQEGRYEPDLDLLESVLKQRTVKHLVFSHPNNPTGAVFSAEQLAQIASLASRYDIRVLVDSLYSRLVFQPERFRHFAAFPGAEDRTTTLLGPSKTESLSGLRLGVAVGPKQSVDAMETMQSISALRAPAYAQQVLRFWLNDDLDWVADRVDQIKEIRELTLASLGRIDVLKIHPQTATAYLWIDASGFGVSDFAIARCLAEKADILVSPGYQFSLGAEGHFRICYARDEVTW